MTTQNWPPIPFGDEKGKKRKNKTDAPGTRNTKPEPAQDGPEYDWIKNLPVIDTRRDTIVIFGARRMGGPRPPGADGNK